MQVEWLSVPIYRVGLNSVIIIDESHGNKEKGGEGERSRVGGGREGGRKDVWRRLGARGGKVMERFRFKFNVLFILRSATRS